MEYQNVSLSLPKDILKNAKHIAVERNISLSKLLASTLEQVVREEEQYLTAQNRQLKLMEEGLELNLEENRSWKRDNLHERRSAGIC